MNDTPLGTMESRDGTCRSCSAAIVWKHNPKTGRWSPYNPDGTSHFSTCPDAEKWRGKKATPMGPVPKREMDDD